MPTDDVSVRRIVVAGALIAGTVALVVGVVVAGLTFWDLPLAGPRRTDYALREPAPALDEVAARRSPSCGAIGTTSRNC